MAVRDYDSYLIEMKEWHEKTRDVPLEGMAQFFEKRIDGYEEHMSVWRRHYEWMAELVPEGTKTLLDLGCGTGLELDCIFKRFPALEVTGIDLSEGMLAELKNKHGDKRLTLVQDDYFVHDFAPESFDAAVSFQSLHHFTAEKKAGAFRRVYDALKHGGTYIECDYTSVNEAFEKLFFEEAALRRRLNNVPEGRFVHFDTPLTLKHEMEAIRAAGFDRVESLGFLEGDDNTAMIVATKQ